MSDLPRRSVRNPGNPGQGTAFYELVVVPTFTPELACPYQVPGGNLIIHPQVPQGGYQLDVSLLLAVPVSDASSSAQINPSLLNADDNVEKRLLYIHVTLEWTERSGKFTRNNACPKKMHDSKLISTAMDVVSTSRVAFVPITLRAHGYVDTFIPPMPMSQNSPMEAVDLCHMEMNWFHLGMWGQAVLAGKCEPTDPLLQDLVTSWNSGTSSTLSRPKPRGCSGPNPARQAASSSTSDTTNLLLTTMVPVMAMMVQNMLQLPLPLLLIVLCRPPLCPLPLRMI
ncbi:hypothetical protein DFH08DRAFT_828472 [Mycena albidolilacea]|uniref:Uncharacterized protein n=1 Tax=Mycena albidolilacea TaxID=1033008 RepID=A0AAD7E6W4_9AGAR|nr:hypothetical protein DFH08DRAFT_828472 [Mycena albidolilacea]